MSTGRRLAAVAVGAIAAVVLAGCSSSSSSAKTGSTTQGGGSSAGSTTTASKSAIRLMVDSTVAPAAAFGGIGFPYPGYGAKAAADAINKTGGIDGHPVKIDVCDNKGDPNQSAVCGRQAKSQGDIAVVGSWDLNGAQTILPILQSEKIPYIGSLAGNIKELSNPISFNFDPASVISPYALVKLFADSGCKKVVEFVPINPGAAMQTAGQKKIAQTLNLSLTTINITVGLADVSAPVSTALSDHPDCSSYAGDGQTTVKLLVALRKSGFTGKFVTAIGSLLPQFLASLGKVADGVIVLNTTLTPDSTDPMVTQYRNDMIASLGAKNAIMNLNEFSQDAWSAVQLVKMALTGSNNYTSAQLLTKIPTMCDVNVGNVYPHVNFCKPATTSTLFPRLFNPYYRYFVAKGGKYVPTDSAWHDVSGTVPSS